MTKPRRVSATGRTSAAISTASATLPGAPSGARRRRVNALLDGGRRAWLGLLAAAVFLPACLSNVALKEQHANFHHCDSGDVSVEDVPNDGYAKYRTQGCGHEETFYCIVAKCRSGRILSVRHHAAEHNCKMEEITTLEPTPMQFVTTGCGHSERYACKEAKNDVLQCTRLK